MNPYPLMPLPTLSIQDVWYPKLAAFTFPSVFLPLKRAEADALVRFHDATWRHALPHGLAPHEVRFAPFL